MPAPPHDSGIAVPSREKRKKREREIAPHCYPRGFDATIGLVAAEQKERENDPYLVGFSVPTIRSNCVPLWFRNLRTRNWVFSRFCNFRNFEKQTRDNIAISFRA